LLLVKARQHSNSKPITIPQQPHHTHGVFVRANQFFFSVPVNVACGAEMTHFSPK